MLSLCNTPSLLMPGSGFYHRIKPLSPPDFSLIRPLSFYYIKSVALLWVHRPQMLELRWLSTLLELILVWLQLLSCTVLVWQTNMKMKNPPITQTCLPWLVSEIISRADQLFIPLPSLLFYDYLLLCYINFPKSTSGDKFLLVLCMHHIFSGTHIFTVFPCFQGWKN